MFYFDPVHFKRPYFELCLDGRSAIRNIVRMRANGKPMTLGKRNNEEPPQARLGLRERSKLDKLKRIKESARDLFLTRGYDNATLREIARVADVGLGTLFAYAADKRDLLFLIVNDDLEAMTASAGQSFRGRGTVEQRLHSIFRNHYVFFAQQPHLSRFMLRELQFYNDTVQATRFQKTRALALGLVERAVQLGQQDGTLSESLDRVLAARVIFGVYQMELREWLSQEPLEISAGMMALDRSIGLVLDGLRLRTAPKEHSAKPVASKRIARG